jgi:flagellar hook-basal body complex protein FliE
MIITMSESKPKKIKEPMVSENKLAEVLSALTTQFDATITELKNSNENMAGELRKSTAEFSRILNEHAEAINALAQQRQQNPGQVQTGNSQKLDDLIQKITAITELPFVKSKLGLEDVNPATQRLQSLGETVALGIQRRSIKELEKIALKQIRRGDLFADEVTGIVTETVTDHGI